MKKEKLQQLGHLLAGVITLVHGFESFEEHDNRSAIIYLSLAIIFLLIAGLHKTISKKFVNGDVAFFILEALTIAYSGWHYREKENWVFSYLMVGAAVLFLVFAFISIMPAKKHKQHRSRHRRRHSTDNISTHSQQESRNE